MIEVRKVYILDGRQLWFASVEGAPGFSHRVIIDGRPVDWLATDYRPSKETAAYYFEKHN